MTQFHSFAHVWASLVRVAYAMRTIVFVNNRGPEVSMSDRMQVTCHAYPYEVLLR